MKKITISKLSGFLKQQCDALRGAGLDAAEYKDYIIAMIFLKRVNDQFQIAQANYKRVLFDENPDLSEQEILDEIEIPNADKYEFYVPILSRWSLAKLPATYKAEQEKLLAEAESQLANDGLEKAIKDRYLEQKRVATANLQWRGVLPVNSNVGEALTIALNVLEESNTDILGGVLSTTKFNAVNTKGEKILSDEVLSQMVKDFNAMQLIDDNFEFPDLLGAAYEYLIKYFAESAGKKGGEFYTPSQVVELMGKVLQPPMDAQICDPTVGSGGLLINMRNYVEARYGTAKHLTIHGQELKDGTYKMCKMNMIFHGIKNADIQQGDTLLDPKLVQNGQLRTYDIVVANPPFSQNYTTSKMQFKERFQNWMSQKKQADFMFVQHMISVLNNNGRMAVVMPHGVLFRGGEEQKMRKRLIESGILECIIGLPPALFYGTGIPASIIIVNKAGAEAREGVFFINADREYKEGKNQNLLRPEDIDKIAHIYTEKVELKNYSRLVYKAELAAEDYNCNIRRYVDNAPEPENHDVDAHLKGGLPAAEVDALDAQLACYTGLKLELFLPARTGYYAFAPAVTEKEQIKTILLQSAGYKTVREAYDTRIQNFWTKVLPQIKALPVNKDIFAFTHELTTHFTEEMAQQTTPLLDAYQSRGALAQYISDLQTDFKSVAASGWNAELIPEEDILESQFPQVLAELKQIQARKEELQAMFDEVKELEKDAWNEEEYEVIPTEQIKEIKAEIKNNKGQQKLIEKEIKALEKRIKAYTKGQDDAAIAQLKTEIVKLEQDCAPYNAAIEEAEQQIAKHIALEEELKTCTANIRTIERRKDELVEQAREKITEAEAEALIIARWLKCLQTTLNSYLDVHTRNLQLAIENMQAKYTTTLTAILSARDEATAKLNQFLEELGYE